MWIPEASSQANYLAFANNVALYHGESIQYDQGKLTLHTDKLQYQCRQGIFSLSISLITNAALRPATLTKSSKIVLLVECKEMIDCAVCQEKTITLTSQCTHCGNKLTWTCDVCEHEDNPIGSKCALCGNLHQQSEGQQQDDHTLIQIFMLSFRGDPPDSIYTSLNTLLHQQAPKTVSTKSRSFGVTRLLEQEEEAALNRDFALASLNGSIDDLVRESRGLVELATELAKLEDDSAKGALKDLGLTNGIRWTDQAQLLTIFESFVTKQFTNSQALLLSDLYCLFNRACALGFFVSVSLFAKCLKALQERGVKVRTVNGVKFLRSHHTSTDDQVIERLCNQPGISVGDLSFECQLPTLIIQCIVNDALQGGRIAMDNHQGDLKYYHNLIIEAASPTTREGESN